MKSHVKSRILGGSRRTRQVFGVNPIIKLLGYLLIAAVVIAGLYLIFGAEKHDKAIKAGEEEKDIIQDIDTDAAPEERDEGEKASSKENITGESPYYLYDYDNPYGDTSNDEGFTGNCKTFMNDLKYDIDKLYEFKVKAQKDYDEKLAELDKAEEKLEKAMEDIKNKRESLEETRQSCIATGNPS